MSGAVGMYLRAELLRRYFLEDWGQELYLALLRRPAPSNATGAQLLEPVGGAYARAGYGVGPERWTASGYGEVFNTASIAFPEATADWGLLTGWALVTTETSGMTLAVGTLTRPDDVVAGMVPVVGAGGLVVALHD